MTACGDVGWFVPWAVVTGWLARTGWVVSGRLFPTDDAVARLGHAVVICWAHVVLVVTVLGAAGHLDPAPLLLLAAVAAALTRLATAPADGRPAPQPVPATRSWVVGWYLLFAFWVGHCLLGAVFQFPDDWDTLMYHLPMVDHWIQARSLYAPDCLMWSNPGNNEVLALWLVAPFSGDFLFGLHNLVPAVLLACAAREVAFRAGLSNVWGNLGALAVVSNFVVIKQLADAENDLAVAALFLASLGYAFRYAAAGRRADLALWAAGLGLLAGVKFYALGYAAVAVAGAAVVTFARGSRPALLAAAAGATGVAVLAGYWYARNWILGGSPFFPLWAAAESESLTERYPDVWATTFAGNGRPELLMLAVRAVWSVTGPCTLAAALAAPATAVWVAAARRNSAGVHVPGVRPALAAATIGAGLVLAITPFAVEDVPGTLNQMALQYCPVRYGLTFLSVAVLCLAGVLDSLGGPPVGRRAVQGLFAAGTAYQFASALDRQTAPVLDAGLLAAHVFLVGVGLRTFLSRSGLPRMLAVVATAGTLLVAGAVGVHHLSERWHEGFAPFYDRAIADGLFTHIARDLPPGQSICVLDHRPYPFFGSARQYRVCQPGSMRPRPWWERYLKDRNIRVIATRLGVNEYAGSQQMVEVFGEMNRERRVDYIQYKPFTIVKYMLILY
jgi:hypothetical protein